jgi:hypothetical protein
MVEKPRARVALAFGSVFILESAAERATIDDRAGRFATATTRHG